MSDVGAVEYMEHEWNVELTSVEGTNQGDSAKTVQSTELVIDVVEGSLEHVRGIGRREETISIVLHSILITELVYLHNPLEFQ